MVAVEAPYCLRLVRPPQSFLTVAVPSWRQNSASRLKAAQVRELVAIPTPGATRQPSPVHKGETETVDG
jgi:hypothetical protein